MVLARFRRNLLTLACQRRWRLSTTLPWFGGLSITFSSKLHLAHTEANESHLLTARPRSVGHPSNRPEMRLLVRHDLMRDNDSFALDGIDTLGKLCARTTNDPSQLRCVRHK
ncbi:hypothetical protein N7G274_004310 [Stereocaulon virgatum]|uniref:Secreted protein n=1 Tax=Stereocaulon virgatum TaxID=373712 RepID=A0ABR4ABV4_9LECA